MDSRVPSLEDVRNIEMKLRPIRISNFIDHDIISFESKTLYKDTLTSRWRIIVNVHIYEHQLSLIRSQGFRYH